MRFEAAEIKNLLKSYQDVKSRWFCSSLGQGGNCLVTT